MQKGFGMLGGNLGTQTVMNTERDSGLSVFLACPTTTLTLAFPGSQGGCFGSFSDLSSHGV